MSKKTLFVLGGSDGEMLVIRQLLTLAGLAHIQPKTGWGDQQYTPAELGIELQTKQVPTGGGHGYSSLYDKEIVVGKEVENVVFVECRPADGWPEHLSNQVIDHHGSRSGESASIMQLLSILSSMAAQLETQREHMQSEKNPAVVAQNIRQVTDRLSPESRRWVELTAANDAGYIPAMLALGATCDEVARVRAFDRSAQGITSAHEKEAERAIREAKTEGRLTVVCMTHSKTATVADRLYGRYDQLLIHSSDDGETNFYGDGALCAALKEKFSGWAGGSGLGKEGGTAYWGGYDGEAEQFIRDYLAK